MNYSSVSYQHGALPITGVLLTNLGTPDAPTPAALRRYLGEFLADPRVVELPRWLWWLALHGIILRVRPRRAAHAYQQVWTPDGSPLLSIARAQTAKIEAALRSRWQAPFHVELGMRYGNPSIPAALERLRQAGAQRLLILPLYPQYASATTGSTLDAVSQVLRGWRWLPDIRFISHYHDWPAYIGAIAASIRESWQQRGQPDKLLFSFHGIPQRTFLAGDPYHCECHKTARLTAEALGLAAEQWQVTFQSRFGREPWLQPYTDVTLKEFGGRKTRRVDVVCPGFSADCLETLEEILVQNREFFLQAGGGEFHYIQALNDRADHIAALADLLAQHAQGWPDMPAAELQIQAAASQQRATAGGAV
jgi:ferrochelatase